MRAFLLALFFELSLVIAPAFAQEPVATKHGDPVPGELAAPIQAQLASGGQQVQIGTKTLEFWWVKSLALQPGSSELAWSSVVEGTLVGAVKLSANYNEIRGRSIKAGVYTLRYALQPSDGNHLGASPHSEFLLLSPAAADTAAGPLGHDGAVNVSKRTIGLSHPAIWSLDPPIAADAPLTLRKNDAGMTAVTFEVPVARDGKDAGLLRFGLVLVGEIQS